MPVAKKTRTAQTKDLTREAFNDIRKRIFSNDLKPGQKIPYRRMAEGMNMSLTPVVQALKHMEFMGLVRHEQNKGFFVENITPAEVDEAYKLRSLLEPELLAATIEGLDPAGEARIKAALEGYLDAAKKGSLKLKIVKDIQFHMAIAECSGRTLSVSILRNLFDFLYLRFGQDVIFSRPGEDSVEAHTAIFQAIRDRDVSRAQALLRTHLADVHKNAMEGIQDRLTEMEEIIF